MAKAIHTMAPAIASTHGWATIQEVPSVVPPPAFGATRGEKTPTPAFVLAAIETRKSFCCSTIVNVH